MAPFRNHCIDSDSAYAILLSKPARGSADESRLFGNRWLPQYAHGVSVLSFSSNHRLLFGELQLGKLSETVVGHGNAPHDRPRFLVNHLIGNRASFLCTKAPMRSVPESGWHSQVLAGLPMSVCEVLHTSQRGIFGRRSVSHAGRLREILRVNEYIISASDLCGLFAGSSGDFLPRSPPAGKASTGDGGRNRAAGPAPLGGIDVTKVNCDQSTRRLCPCQPMPSATSGRAPP